MGHTINSLLFFSSSTHAHRQELIKWNGWGYNDSGFVPVNDEVLKFVGDR